MNDDNPNTPLTDSAIALPSTRAAVDSYLKILFSERRRQAKRVSQRYDNLWKTAETLALSGGKRLRPYITLLAYEAFADDQPSETVMHAAVAMELIHIAMLIHDDIIDRDDTRYGIANISGQYMQEYADLQPDDQRHFANSAALLMGDVLIAEAHRLLAISSDDLARLRKAQLAFSKAILHVVGGELVDTEASFRRTEGTQAITIARYKTASYSFVGPLSIGAHLAGADEASVAGLSEYADALGIAFQLKDDLLGTFGDSLVTGKSSDTDLREGKRTYLIEQFDEVASEALKDEFYTLFGSQTLSDEQAQRLRDILTDSGAVAKTNEAIQTYATKARGALAALQIPLESARKFEELITLSIDRQK
jgi:geranylgeranyl pyrophosphate synthase